ncbi:MAG: universal stress protein [Deltaproteobacteria bacterium]|nr:universal stress protein [Deltaproteobacteria bacterium]
MYKHILVPLDGSTLAETVLPHVERLAKENGAKISLLQVVIAHTIPGTDPTDAQVEVVERAKKYLGQVAEKLEQAGLTVETHIRYGHDAEEILDHAESNDIDLVAMCSHGQSGIGRWNLGGVTKRVVSHCIKPVLTIRARP